MKSVRWAALGLVITAILSGCKDFWDLPTSTTTTTTTPTTLSSGVFYVLDQTTKQLDAYVISSGTLDTVSGSPYTLPSAPTSIAVASNGLFLYVGTVNGIYLYTVGSGGALSIGNSGNPIATDIPAAMVISGSWLIDAFVTANNSPQIDAIAINPSNGLYDGPGGAAPSQVFGNITNAAIKGMVLSPDDANLFVALGTAGTHCRSLPLWRCESAGSDSNVDSACKYRRLGAFRGRRSEHHASSVLHRRNRWDCGRTTRLQLQLARHSPKPHAGHWLSHFERRPCAERHFAPRQWRLRLCRERHGHHISGENRLVSHHRRRKHVHSRGGKFDRIRHSADQPGRG